MKRTLLNLVPVPSLVSAMFSTSRASSSLSIRSISPLLGAAFGLLLSSLPCRLVAAIVQNGGFE
jgi:hypothetical protein